ncbi:MAG: tRNA pseudouridine(38-40) synthase TruA [Nitrospirales bacterium]
MPTIKLTLEYEGTAYAGWQQQPNLPTIQGQLEQALLQITQHHIPVVGAGRTDAGVHALGQVASFHSDKNLSSPKWAQALNRYLPRDIAVLQSEYVADTFHARYSARGKVYEYRIRLHPSRSALDRNRVWHIHTSLDLSRMQRTIPWLIGTYDCSSFEGPRAGSHHQICRISQMALHQHEDLLTIRIEADRFLKQMVRTIVGTVVEVGRKRREPDDIQAILEARDRRAAGETAPPQGLYLVKVLY